MTPERQKMLVFGATGAVGRQVVAEARRRGHAVTGVARRPSPGVVQGDAADPADVRRLAKGHDVVVSATRPASGQEAELVETANSLVAGLSGTGCRLIVVGGAASLIVPASNGVLALNDPNYVREGWRAIAQACVDQLRVLRSADALACTYVSPPALLEHGARTGAYRVDTTHLVVDTVGRSRISYADFAVAIVDEIENCKFLRGRLTVGY